MVPDVNVTNVMCGSTVIFILQGFFFLKLEIQHYRQTIIIINEVFDTSDRGFRMKWGN